MSRYLDNLKILKYLRILVEKYPDQRFGQILSNYVIPPDVFDLFFPEGEEFIKNMEKYVFPPESRNPEN